MHRPTRHAILAVLIALLTTACGTSTPTTPTTPTTPVTTTETFSGTLTLNGALLFSFSAAAAGTITATLTSVGPDNTVPVGFNLGTYTNNVCSIVLSNPKATQGAVLTGTASAAGTLCSLVHDPNGTLTAPVDFQITVVHP